MPREIRDPSSILASLVVDLLSITTLQTHFIQVPYSLSLTFYHSVTLSCSLFTFLFCLSLSLLRFPLSSLCLPPSLSLLSAIYNTLSLILSPASSHLSCHIHSFISSCHPSFFTSAYSTQSLPYTSPYFTFLIQLTLSYISPYREKIKTHSPTPWSSFSTVGNSGITDDGPKAC